MESPLSNEMLGQLVPITPTLISWLMHVERKAADLFLESNTDDAQVSKALRDLLNALNYNVDLTMVQIRYMCSCYTPNIWAAGVRLILSNCSPRLVAKNVGTELIDSLAKANKTKSTKSLSLLLGPELDKLSRSSFVALAEFCGLIKHTGGGNVQTLASLTGPLLLAPNKGTGSKKEDDCAASMMTLLVENCEGLFGKPSCYVENSFGLRKLIKLIDNKDQGKPSKDMKASKKALGRGQKQPNPPPGLEPETDAEKIEKKLAKRKQTLRTFYDWRDPSRARIVEQLFMYHEFVDIAQAIHLKYGMLPPGWRTDLVELRKSGAKIEWLNEKKKRFSRPLSFVPRKKSDVKIKGADTVDNIIDEIIEKEKTYYGCLNELMTVYVEEIKTVAEGKRGTQLMNELGININQIDKIFGWRLAEILKVSESFLIKLEVVSLIRKAPLTEVGRAGLIAEAFHEVNPELHVYAPYVSSYKSSLAALEKATTQLQRSNKSGKGFRKTGKAQTFLKTWELVAASSNYLNAQSIESILIKPVQKVPQYELLLKQLSKEIEPDHPAADMLDDIIEMVSVTANELNKAKHTQDKIDQMFGEDITPIDSKKGQKGKIKTFYN